MQIQKDFPNAVFFSFKKISTNLNADGKIKKDLIGLPLHSSIKKTTIQNGHKAYAMRTGAISGVTVLDFDKIEVYEKLTSQFKYLKKCYSVKTLKGYHIYFNYDSRLKTNSDVMSDFEGVDIRNDSNGFIICPPTTYTIPNGETVAYKLIGGDIINFPDDLFKLLNAKGAKGIDKEKLTKTKKEKVNKTNANDDENDIDYFENKYFNKQQLCALVELIDAKRANDYSEWSKMGLIIHQCNSGDDGFEAFDLFSKKCPEKYTNKNDCRKQWNTYKKNYTEVSAGSLIYYSRLDNKDGFDKLCALDLLCELDHFDATIFNTQYILGDKSDWIKEKINEWMNKYKVFGIKSDCNTGKTQTNHYIIDTYKPKKILFITYRQTLSYNFEGSFGERHNVKNYIDNNFECDRIICQIESLHKLIKCNLFGVYEVPIYDLVIMDESESILSHLESPTIDNKLYTFNILDAILKKSKKILALDGDFSNQTYDYLKSVNDDEHFTVLKNQYVPAVKTWNFTNNKSNFDDELDNDLKNGKKIYISTMSSEMGNKYEQKYKDKYRVCLHTSTTDDILKTELKDVNNFWINYDLVIASPTIEAGVDFNVEYFDKLYVILSAGSTGPRGLNQMTARVRKLKDLNVPCYLNSIAYAERASLYRFDEVNIMFNTHLKDVNIEVDEEGNITNKNTALTLINKYNYVETLNKKKAYFVPSLIKLLKKKGQKYTFDDSSYKKSKDTNITKQLFVEANNIDKSEYAQLLQLQKQNLATKENKIEIEKYTYKVNWKLTNDEMQQPELLKRIYRKTHILFNQQAIKGLEVKSFKSIDDTYIDVETKIKNQKLKIVNELLKILKLKNENNEFNTGHLEKEEWELLTQKAISKSTYFNDKTIPALFEMKKQPITTNKKFLGVINSILQNYGFKIYCCQYGNNKSKAKITINEINLKAFDDE